MKRPPAGAAKTGSDRRGSAARARIRQTEERYAIAARETGQIIYDYDLRRGRIRWSGAVRSITGYEARELGTDIRTWRRMVHPEDRREAFRAVTGDRYLAEYRLRTRSGGWRDIRETGTVLPGRDGGPRRMIGTMVDVTERKKDERLKAAVYRIADLTLMTESLEDLFKSIHETISGLMPALNFYIAIYDAETNLLSFPYFVDEYDPAPATRPPLRGLTEYVLRSGQSQLVDPVRFEELIRSGEVESIGAPSIDWLGVPLRSKDRTIGVMVVQTYREGVRYTPEDQAILQYVSAQSALAIERRRTEERRRAAERIVSTAFSSIQDGVSILDSHFRIVRLNETMERWYAHAAPFAGKICFEAYHGRREPCEACPTARVLLTGEASSGLVPRRGAGGEITGWLEVFSFPMIGPGSEGMIGAIEYARDITERKAAEDALRASLKEKEVLLKEVHHRVKNNMQVITSLLDLQARRLNDPAAVRMFQDSCNRIRSMALVHEKLYQSADLSRVDFEPYVRNLMTHLVQACRVHPGRVELKIDVPEVFLGIQTAIPCGLILNELAANALKHAFPDGRKGTIRVTLRPRRGRGRYRLTVKDDGIGLPPEFDPARSSSLGLQLVTMLVGQLNGTVERGPGPGTEFRIAFSEAPERPPA